MEEENPIYKEILEKEENIIPKNNNINIQNIQHKSSIVISRAQIYHYEKTIHDLTLQNNDMNELREKLNLQLNKYKALIDNQKREIEILKSQTINQTNNNKILDQKIIENETMIKELKNMNEKIVKNEKIKYESINKDLIEKEKKIKTLEQKIKAKDESIKYFTINENLEKKYQLNYKNELDQEKEKNKKLENKINNLNKQIDNLYLQNKSEGSLMLEIEKLKDDNIKLIQMLKAMKHAEDLETLSTNSSTVIKNIKTYEKNKKNKNNNNILLNQVFGYSVKLKQKYGLDISNEILKNFIVGINRIWQDKYEEDMKLIKNNLKKELDNYQNQIYKKNLDNNENVFNKEYEKGCLWMVEKCYEEIYELDKNFDELILEYEEKIKNTEKVNNNDNETDNEYYRRLINNSVKWFFSTLKCTIYDIKNKMDNWKIEIKNKCNFS